MPAIALFVISLMASLLRLEEDFAEVRSVDKRVAHGAGLVLLRLVMRRPDWRLRRHIAHRLCVALEAKQVHLAHAHQPWVGRTMRSVAARATFRLYRQVL